MLLVLLLPIWSDGSASASTISVATGGSSFSSRDALRTAVEAGRAGVAFLEAVGEITLTVAERLPTACLGSLTCLALPLALVGIWTLRNLNRILGILQFRESTRSLLGD
ncbi:hypothetical protein FJY94_04590 [Candidatus Kaiserbacteria bacterium]|nr:hypothetical protein [Candidatus Kaiserbacteria bacterium]